MTIRTPWARSNGLQWAVLAAALLALCLLLGTLAANLDGKNIRTGFAFLGDRAGFAIGETLVPYGPGDSFAAALLVGLLNTLLISSLGIIFSTLLGLAICLARLSPNWLLARLAGLYVEVIRNIPLLLQMFVWYAILLFSLSPPIPDSGRSFALDNRGLHLPALASTGTLLAAATAGLFVWLALRRTRLGRERCGLSQLAGTVVAVAVLLLSGAEVDWPLSGRFGFGGGLSLTTEFLALVVGLSIYTAAYLAEIFRAAILAVPLGQREAAAALGLGSGETMRRIILPQALRIAIPPMTSWHLNTVKNSSLGVAIGYPEFVSVVDTVISQTGQAIEGVALIVGTFLSLSLLLAFVTDRYARSYGWSLTGQAGRQIVAGATEQLPILLPAKWSGWARRNLFASAKQSILSAFVLLVVSAAIWKAIIWLIADATFSGGAAACRAADGTCWPFLRENATLILFGTYPEAEQWRAALATMLLLGCLGLSFVARLWGRRLAIVWVLGIAASLFVLRGGFGVLVPVPMDKWSGLPVTLLLASIAVLAAFPLAVLLAFARQSANPLVKRLATGLIELVRGIPLIGVLFLAAVMFPLFVPDWLSIDSLPRVQLALIIFTAAYMAEAIRGGLISVSVGQSEAAQALGLSKWQARRHIELPQALKVSLPALVNTSISEVKNTTLVLIVGVFDLLQTTRLSYVEAQWRPYFAEAYLFSGTIFFAICFALSRLAMKIERKLSHER
ncbi:ABC transporter permease subunit [Sphingobium fluviale]|uniref:ABC transporter permease subunit n=1 Tax=Sphingobium fluviale TaxID=2506423 RepID=A0A4V1N355_9SPHN|nr:ABC transporter permease subunit [Sphingobium fluviale]RXR25212.1 ABC transporter permease subunit [Sphingobium fluviale]